MATQVEAFEKSYSEALAALKHQDDKLNRMLTALAFLTAAGVAIFVNLDKGPAVRFANDGPSVGAVLFVLFVSAVALALLSALSAIGPGKPLASDQDGSQTSLLFYPLIARDDWDAMKEKDDEGLKNELVDNYHNEARDIAYRVRYKVARARESSAFVQLAIVSLALLGIFETRPLSMTTRWWIAAGFMILVLLSQFLELIQMKHHHYGKARWGAIYWWLLAGVGFVAAMLIRAQAITDDYWEALGYGLAVLLLARLAVVSSKTATGFVVVATLAAIPIIIIAVLP